MLPVRFALGLMWLGESVAKVLEGWLDASRGTSSSWMFSPGVVQPGVDPDTVGAATEAAKAVTVHDFLGFMAQPILPHDFFLVQWMQGFMDSVVSQVYAEPSRQDTFHDFFRLIPSVSGQAAASRNSTFWKRAS